MFVTAGGKGSVGAIRTPETYKAKVERKQDYPLDLFPPAVLTLLEYDRATTAKESIAVYENILLGESTEVLFGSRNLDT